MRISKTAQAVTSRIYQRSFNLGFLFFLAFILNALLEWPILTATHMRGWRNFIDSYQVLMSADCYSKIGFEIYRRVPGDWCGNYVYGRSLIYVLHFLHLSSIATIFLGILFALLVSFFFGYIVKKLTSPSIHSFMIMFLVFLSAPITLLLERANFDSLIFILVFLALLAYKRGYTNISVLLIVVSALFKFYTLPVLLLLLLERNSRRRRISYFVIVVSTTIIAIQDVFKANSISIENPNASFGAPMFGLLLNRLHISMSFNTDMMIGWVLILISAGILVLLRRKSKFFKEIFTSSYDVIGFDFEVVFGLIFVACYIFGLNCDYRLIFLVPAILATINRQESSLGRKVFLVILVVIFWFSFDSRILQPIGDAAVGILCSYYIVEFGAKIWAMLKTRAMIDD